MSQSRRHRRVRTAAMLAIAAGIAAATSAAMCAPRDGFTRVRTTYGKLPLRVCLQTDARTVASLKRGETRLLLQLRNVEAWPRHSAPFSLHRVVGEQRGPLIETFGMQPDHLEEGRVEPQSFLFAVREVEAGKVCFDLEQDRARPDVAPADAVLEIGIRWIRQP